MKPQKIIAPSQRDGDVDLYFYVPLFMHKSGIHNSILHINLELSSEFLQRISTENFYRFWSSDIRIEKK